MEDKNYFNKVCSYRILCTKFSWSHLLMHDDKNVTFFLLGQESTFFHMGISSPGFKKREEDSSLPQREPLTTDCSQQETTTGTSLAVQWLRLCFQCRGRGFDPGWGTKIPHALWQSQKKKRKKPPQPQSIVLLQ